MKPLSFSSFFFLFRRTRHSVLVTPPDQTAALREEGTKGRCAGHYVYLMGESLADDPVGQFASRGGNLNILMRNTT